MEMPLEHPWLYFKWILRLIHKGRYMFIYLINSTQTPGENMAFKRENQCPSTKTKRSCMIRVTICPAAGLLGLSWQPAQSTRLSTPTWEQSHRVCQWKATSAGAARQIASFGRSSLNIYPLQKSCDVRCISHLDYFLLELNHVGVPESLQCHPAVTAVVKRKTAISIFFTL